MYICTFYTFYKEYGVQQKGEERCQKSFSNPQGEYDLSIGLWIMTNFSGRWDPMDFKIHGCTDIAIFPCINIARFVLWSLRIIVKSLNISYILYSYLSLNLESIVRFLQSASTPNTYSAEILAKRTRRQYLQV